MRRHPIKSKQKCKNIANYMCTGRTMQKLIVYLQLNRWQRSDIYLAKLNLLVQVSYNRQYTSPANKHSSNIQNYLATSVQFNNTNYSWNAIGNIM